MNNNYNNWCFHTMDDNNTAQHLDSMFDSDSEALGNYDYADSLELDAVDLHTIRDLYKF